MQAVTIIVMEVVVVVLEEVVAVAVYYSSSSSTSGSSSSSSSSSCSSCRRQSSTCKTSNSNSGLPRTHGAHYDPSFLVQWLTETPHAQNPYVSLHQQISGIPMHKVRPVGRELRPLLWMCVERFLSG